MTTAIAATPQSPPSQSIEQRMAALGRANEIRTLRARYKRNVKAGRVDLVHTVLAPPDWMVTAKLSDFMLCLPRWGRVKVNRALTHMRISPSKTIGGLSDRQRHEIVAYLRAKRTT